MKPCMKCGNIKPLTEFRKDNRKPGGCTNECKSCALASMREWRGQNRDKVRESNARWNARNRATLAASQREYAASNREELSSKQREKRRQNPHIPRAQSVAREATKLRATPAWANRFFLSEAYALARLRTKVTGFLWHVDHIVPLRSPIVCGLHCEANIRVIPASLNCRKNNRHWPDMPSNKEPK